jgi:hypothetical protein
MTYAKTALTLQSAIRRFVRLDTTCIVGLDVV